MNATVRRTSHGVGQLAHRTRMSMAYDGRGMDNVKPHPLSDNLRQRLGGATVPFERAILILSLRAVKHLPVAAGDPASPLASAGQPKL